ncbi:Lrp/AsnC family transcriptional regulator [Roseobacter sp.]|uniref:Lrp/AsnC family transcriptional regulator n=1 Tax=Roseobacter sp. TaxID=1907202 RepID=UPI0038586585
MIDGNFLETLSHLQKDASRSKADIARKVGLTPSTISKRVRRRQPDKVIEGYEVHFNPSVLGQSLLAFIFVTNAKPSQGLDTAAGSSKVIGLEELHKVAGEVCCFMKVGAAGIDHSGSLSDPCENHNLTSGCTGATPPRRKHVLVAMRSH